MGASAGRSGSADAPVQRQRATAGKALQMQWASETARWTKTVMRPDLYPAPVQRAAAGTSADSGQDLPSDGGGKEMPESVQAKMEGAFATDFSAVRIHEGPRSEALGARAYTQGTEVHFAPGEYQPSSQSGQALLGHELTHVVQQSQGRVSATTQAKSVDVNDDAGLEREADEMGAKAARGESVGGASTNAVGAASGPVVQGLFAQGDDAERLQESHHGGVKSQYTTAENMVELHIDAGANNGGTMMQDFLAALWEARAAIHAGQARAPGGLFMRPGGAQVLKLTMEMLGEALGQGESLDAARNAKRVRKAADQPMGAGIDPDMVNDTLDSTVVPEHLAYRDALVGAPGVAMNPIGRGTQGGTVDMLAATPDGAAERASYDDAVITLTPLMSLAITLDLAALERVIAMMERQIPFLKLLGLKAKFKLQG